IMLNVYAATANPRESKVNLRSILAEPSAQTGEAAPLEKFRTKIAARDLAVYYRSLKAVTGVNLNIAANRITAIIGPSGCGKSTLVRSLNRMTDLVPGARATGEVLLDGENILASDVDVVNVRRRIGMVFQRPNPFPKSIFDNV